MSKFEIVDFTSNGVVGKPDMRACGITPAVLFGQWNLFGGGSIHSPWIDEESVVKGIESYPDGTTFAAEFEGRPWHTHGNSLIPENLDRLIRAVEFFRSVNSTHRWTLYGRTPHWTMSSAATSLTCPRQSGWLQMVRDIKPLADVLDICSPYFYVRADVVIDPANKTKSYCWLEHSPDEWLHMMRMVLDTCRDLYTTPIYAWVWPEYAWPHWRFRQNQDQDTGEYPYQFLAQRLMPEHVWRRIVDTAWNHADGLAIWGLHPGGGPEQEIEWDESARWYNILREYAFKAGAN